METINGEGILAQARESPSQYHLLTYEGLKLESKSMTYIENKKTGTVYITPTEYFNLCFKNELKKVKWRRIQRRYNNGTNK